MKRASVFRLVSNSKFHTCFCGSAVGVLRTKTGHVVPLVVGTSKYGWKFYFRLETAAGDASVLHFLPASCEAQLRLRSDVL